MKSINKIVNGINITVDYRTELLGVLMVIGNYHKKFPQLFNNYNNNRFYIDMIKDRFNHYKDDEVVREFDDIVRKHSFNYDAPFSLFLQLDDNLNTKSLNEYVFNDRLNSDKKIYDFIDKLNDFSKRINFEEFYNSNKNLYKSWIDNISGAFLKYDIISFFNNYYGYSIDKEFVVDICSFTTDGAYCCDLDDRIVNCFPVYREMERERLFDSVGKEELILQNPMHEFSHGYVNPITRKYDILNKDTNLFDDIRDIMKKQAYPYDSHIINEHIVRGIEARYIYLVYGDIEWYNERIKSEKELGFKYIEVVLNSLIYYENNRDIYKKFDDYYPIIIENIRRV